MGSSIKGKEKAVVGGITSGALTFLGGVSASLENGITGAEWITIAIATIISLAAAFGIVYQVPNSTPPTPEV